MPNLQNQSLSESGQIVTTGDTGVVTSTMILDGTISNTDVSTSAAIDLSKLASGSSAQVILANATGVATYVTPSGDVSWDNTGNVQIVANTIVNADINSNAAIALTKLASGSSAQILLANSTGVATYTAVSGDITITNAGVTALASNITISNNLTVTGDLTVSGNTTTLNTANLNVEDNFIMLNSGETSSPTLNAGIEVERGTSTNVLISWDETTDKWQFTNDGSTYDNIAGTASPTFTGTVTGSPAAGTTATAASGIGYMGLPQNSTTTGAYGVVAADAGLHIYSTATRTVTIPANSNVAMPVGTTLVFIAGTGATVTIAITTDTMYLAGIGSTGSRTLAALGMATAVKIASTTWIISGNGLT